MHEQVDTKMYSYCTYCTYIPVTIFKLNINCNQWKYMQGMNIIKRLWRFHRKTVQYLYKEIIQTDGCQNQQNKLIKHCTTDWYTQLKIIYASSFPHICPTVKYLWVFPICMSALKLMKTQELHKIHTLIKACNMKYMHLLYTRIKETKTVRDISHTNLFNVAP